MNIPDRELLGKWIVDALKTTNGSATVLDVAKAVWEAHGNEIKDAGDLFYNWQYELRWAAKNLRDQKILKAADESDRGIWELDTDR